MFTAYRLAIACCQCFVAFDASYASWGYFGLLGTVFVVSAEFGLTWAPTDAATKAVLCSASILTPLGRDPGFPLARFAPSLKRTKPLAGQKLIGTFRAPNNVPLIKLGSQTYQRCSLLDLLIFLRQGPSNQL